MVKGWRLAVIDHWPALIYSAAYVTMCKSFDRKKKVKSYGCDKMCMDKHLIENKQCQLVDQFNEKLVI